MVAFFQANKENKSDPVLAGFIVVTQAVVA